MPTPGPNLKLGVPLFLIVFIVAAIGLYAGAKTVEPAKTASATADDSGGVPTGPVNVTVVAKNTAFDKKTITAAAGTTVTVTFDNEDAGVLHNIAFYTNKSAATKIAAADIVTGPGTVTLPFTAPGVAGNYYFRCDVHPDQMNGTFAVK